MTSTAWRSRLPLVVLVGMFLASFVGAYLLYASGWRPSATKNYGELVQPARPIADVTLTDIDGKPATFASLHGKWTLIYFGSAECASSCIDALYKMRQLEAAQGREAHRIRRVFVITDARPLDMLRYTLKDYPGTLVYTGPTPAVHALAAQFRVPAGGALDSLHRLYVVDPLGNFMMSYPANAELRLINKDIGLLLRTSQVG